MRAINAHLNRLKNIIVSRILNARTAASALVVVLVTCSALTARNPQPTAAAPMPTSAAASLSDGGGVRTQLDSPSSADAQAPRNFDELIKKANVEGSVRVLVGLRSGFMPEGALKDALRSRQRVEISLKQDSLLRRLTPFAPRGIKHFKSIPYLAMTVNVEALEFMKASPEVEYIREDGINRPTLADSRVLVGADKAEGLGYSGQGQVVAILDTGVEKTHPFLSGKVVSEACFSTNSPEEYISSLCPAQAEESTAPGSATPCTLGVEKGCEHGTHVAGIVAGRLPTDNVQGVAKDAKVVAIQVFSKLERPGACGVDERGNDLAPCVRVYDSDYMLGLEHVLGLKQSGVPIAAANLSLGSDKVFSEKCDGKYRGVKKLIDNLESVGVATVVASGNGDPESGVGYKNAISSPACISSAISVGSVGDGSGNPEKPKEPVAQKDVVSTFSNGAPFLKLLAPGQWIKSASLNGGYETLGGTSMAAPHVAGAWAVLKQRSPNASVAQVLAALQNTGRPTLVDSQTGLHIPRIRIDGALQSALSCNYSLSAGSEAAAAAGDLKSFNVIAPVGCPWTATSGVEWIFTDASGNGNGTVVFTVAVNSGAARAGTILVGGHTFVVNQAAGQGDSSGRVKLTLEDGLPGDLFGKSVAVSGSTAIVGAPGDNIGGGLNKGSAYVFIRNPDGTWSQQAKLLAADGAASDEFGWSVAIDGDTAVVGAKAAAVGARAHQGAVYVFARLGAAWVQQAKLVSAPDTPLGTLDDGFGAAVAIHRDRVVVGSPGFETYDPFFGVFQRGGLYIFNRSGTTWTQNPLVLWGGFNEMMGGSLATADFTFQGSAMSAILVGKPNASPGSILGAPPSRYGAVVPYVRVAGPIEWPEGQRIYAPDFADGDKFGSCVAFASDGTVVVGSPSDDTGKKLDHGSAYVLTPTAGARGVTWAQQAKLTADDGEDSDHFGNSVGISGNFIIVGASSAGRGRCPEAGGGLHLRARRRRLDSEEETDRGGRRAF